MKLSEFDADSCASKQPQQTMTMTTKTTTTTTKTTTKQLRKVMHLSSPEYVYVRTEWSKKSLLCVLCYHILFRFLKIIHLIVSAIILNGMLTFSDASKHLYMRVCPSVRWSVRRFVCRFVHLSVSWSVTLLQKPSYRDAEGASSCLAGLVFLRKYENRAYRGIFSDFYRIFDCFQ